MLEELEPSLSVQDERDLASVATAEAWRRADRQIYMRRRYLTINGKKVVCAKREWKGFCELCGKNGSRLDYHHWDNEHTECGMWICKRCHQTCTALELLEREPEFKERYLALKRKINQGNI